MAAPARRAPTLLLLSQVYVPDPASVGQHLHDVAVEMTRRGWRVVVYTSARGYDDPSHRYPRLERADGVEIRRLPLSSFGKRSIALRLLAGFSFLAQATVRGLSTRRLTSVLISTSPPMAGIAALLFHAFRGVPFAFWAMDINPDQMIAMGGTAPGSLPARLFEALNRQVLRHARNVVTLDRYMRERLERKKVAGRRLKVLPPWPHDDHLEPVNHADNPFRDEHGLGGKRVIAYSGNISPSHPVATILEAARLLRDDQSLFFLFIGGGLGAKAIERFIERERLGNAAWLPYQPLDRLRYSLSAADVHLVAMGNHMVGVSHPCKIYGAMAVARPILLLGPRDCHAGEIVERFKIGWRVDHGNPAAAVRTLRYIEDADPALLAEMGSRARDAVSRDYAKRVLCGAFCDTLEAGLQDDPAVARTQPGHPLGSSG